MSLHHTYDSDVISPHHQFDQYCGLHTEDSVAPWAFPDMRPMLRNGYFRPWRVKNEDHGSTVINDKEKFQVSLDVKHFTPEELTVKVIDDCVVIEGKHEEKEDEFGFVSRQFSRRYILPKGHDATGIVSNLSSDGVLTITAPKINEIVGDERIIPINSTGKPHKIVTKIEKV